MTGRGGGVVGWGGARQRRVWVNNLLFLKANEGASPKFIIHNLYVVQFISGGARASPRPWDRRSGLQVIPTDVHSACPGVQEAPRKHASRLHHWKLRSEEKQQSGDGGDLREGQGW